MRDQFFEPLEGRRLMSVVWANRGKADNFAAVFGANAPAAREVVNAAIADWNAALPKAKLKVTIRATDLEKGKKSPTLVSQSRGTTIELDKDAAKAGWYFDRNLADNAEVTATPTAYAGTGSFAGRDFYTAVLRELGRVLGFRDTNKPYKAKTGKAVKADVLFTARANDLMTGGTLPKSTRYLISPYDIVHMPAAVRPASKTPGAPRNMVTATATTGQAAVRVQWNAIGGASGYDLYRSTTHAAGHVAADATLIGSGGGGATYYVDTEATPGQTYWYYVVPQLADAYARAEATVTGSAVGLPAETPTVTRALPAVSVQWAPAVGVDHYAVYRTSGAATNSSSFLFLADVPAGQTSWTDTSAAPLTAYSYMVRAEFDGDTETSPSMGYAPTAVGYAFPGGTVTAESGIVNHIFWDTEQAASRYNVYRAEDGGPTSRTAAGAQLIATTGMGVTHYADTAPMAGQAYRYWVTAVTSDPTGAAAELEMDLSNSASATVAPSAGTVGTVLATDSRTDLVEITWDAVPSAISYEVYVGAATAGVHDWGSAYHFTAIGGAAATSAQWGFPTPSRFWVVAQFGDGSTQEVGSDVGSINRLTATDGNLSSGIRVTFGTWANPSPKWFEVYRSTTPGDFATVRPAYVGSADGTATSFDDTTPTPSVTYYYWAYAVFAGSGASANSYLGIFGSESGWRA